MRQTTNPALAPGLSVTIWKRVRIVMVERRREIASK